MKAVVIGIEGAELTPAEASLVLLHEPAGIILFGRNIEGALSLSRLVGDLREVMPLGAQLFIDQEGGRVARLRPPDWTTQPAAGLVGAVFDADAAAGLRLAWLTGALIGVECRDAGFDVVCAPVLDLFVAGATDAIGDRAYGGDPVRVAALAQSMADGLLSAGVQPVGKHVPGHGRARVDSHDEMPYVGADEDLGPDIEVFTRCATMPWMMTAHIIYAGLDPARPATQSPRIIEDLIRGDIGFEGVLISDDLAMGALSGTPGERVKATMAAGCDLALHCSGVMKDNEAVLKAAPQVSAMALARMRRAASLAARCQLSLNRDSLIQDQADLLTAVLAA